VYPTLRNANITDCRYSDDTARAPCALPFFSTLRQPTMELRMVPIEQIAGECDAPCARFRGFVLDFDGVYPDNGFHVRIIGHWTLLVFRFVPVKEIGKIII
jgi:hypothetical protein